MKAALRRFAGAAAGCALALAAAGAQAQSWPTKPIIMLNPFPAGGGTDTFARPIAAKLSQTLGQQVLIENQGGAGGTVGAANVVKRAPDGYNWFFGAVHHTIAESLYTRLPYSLEKDFEPVTVAAFVPNVVVVHPKHKDKFKTLKDLIGYAKANPDKLNYGSAGNGTSHHLAPELFKISTETKINHVPYKGAGPAMQDLIAGQVDLMFDGMGSSAPQIRAGRLKALAVTTPTRSSAFPDLPTLQELGVPNYEVTTWYGLWAPAGTPADIINKLKDEVAKAMQRPEIKEAWAAQGSGMGGNTPQEFAKFVNAEVVKWGKVAKAANITID